MAVEVADFFSPHLWLYHLPRIHIYKYSLKVWICLITTKLTSLL